MKILCCQSCKRERILREELNEAKEANLKGFKILYVRENDKCKRCQWEERSEADKNFERSIEENLL